METQTHQRFVSLLTRKTIALVLAGGRGSRLYELTSWRAKPAVPFGGKFRIIDFPLSNAVNSGIRRIGVLTQYKAHSLVTHLSLGWSGFKSELGEFVEVLPASQRVANDWYQGTADAIYQNLDIIRPHRPDYVLVLSGDHIYKMDYGTMLAFHTECGSDMTISCLEVPVEEAAGAYGVIEVDENSRVIGFEEKPKQPKCVPGRPDVCLASMGNYIFNTQFLFDQLILDADNKESEHDFGKNIIPGIIADYQVFAFPFRDLQTGKRAYWRDVGTLEAFWEANMELLSVTPELNLYDSDWPILTHQGQLPPAKFVFNDDGRRGMAVDSMVSGGCVVSGAKLDRALLFSNVKVKSYTQVEESVVLPGVTIGRHVRIKRAIIDRGCDIPEGMIIGEDHEQDRQQGFRVTGNGIVLVTPDMLNQSIHFSR
ncbi:MAG: glucose-1-phosphate adenylyltransferase [Chromatiaceae bacterium]|nr:glucose-1-phosphate adenylyltransferase [Gammaproteobacteria bacterium]MCB1880034.1 glucose-1-phosphate adenylyltransferase [Gammaproteobacteria bacterium]MCB1904287.1 glucose-1-phosphate adenylyltransferase [Gammaproteobacteria bacterium]MCP5446291.1 glucose-1-phosphate adenylyltransferase [Chromatiaceae bacterium]